MADRGRDAPLSRPRSPTTWRSEAERVFHAAGYGRRFEEWEAEAWWERYFADVPR